jgi:hypothetical protein
MGGARSTKGRRGTRNSLLIGKPEGKRPLRRRWMDNIKMNVGEVGWDDTNWIGLAQDKDKWRALVNAVMDLRVP